jgi:hypothetical protein
VGTKSILIELCLELLVSRLAKSSSDDDIGGTVIRA